MVLNIPTVSQIRGYEEIGEASSAGADGVVFTLQQEYRHIMMIGGAYGVGGTSPSLYLRCNTDAAGYSNQVIYTTNSAENVLNRIANDPGIHLGTANLNGRSSIMLEGSVSRYQGCNRAFTARIAENSTATAIYFRLVGGRWNNTADPLTTMRIYSTTTALVAYDFLLLGKR
jgi:hypothetical protein